LLYFIHPLVLQAVLRLQTLRQIFAVLLKSAIVHFGHPA
jgi:hypothetical protein